MLIWHPNSTTCFWTQVAATIAGVLAEFSDAPGLVFDLRGNRGGDDKQAPSFLSFFEDDNSTWLYEYQSYGNRFLNQTKHGTLRGCLTDNDPDDYSIIESMTLYTEAQSEYPRWTKPLVVLINSR